MFCTFLQNIQFIALAIKYRSDGQVTSQGKRLKFAHLFSFSIGKFLRCQQGDQIGQFLTCWATFESSL